MIRKLALVGAAVAATLVALSPLAFAEQEPPSGDAPTIGDVEAPGDHSKTGLVNLDDVNVLNGTNVCPDVGVGLLGILGDGGSVACDSLSGE